MTRQKGCNNCYTKSPHAVDPQGCLDNGHISFIDKKMKGSNSIFILFFYLIGEHVARAFEPHPAIHLDDGPSDQAAVVTGEVYNHFGDVFTLAHLPHGDCCGGGGQPCLVFVLCVPSYSFDEV